MRKPRSPEEQATEKTAGKTRTLRVRLDERTCSIVNSKADEAGMSVSEYVRSSCLRSTIRSNAPLLYQLNRIANGLHEIARQARSQRLLDVAILQSILEIEHEVRKL